MILGPCHVCGRDVESMLPHSYRVIGWEAVRRSGGGANRIIERTRLGAVAHTMCVEQRAKRRRSGIADEQQVLS